MTTTHIVYSHDPSFAWYFLADQGSLQKAKVTLWQQHINPHYNAYCVLDNDPTLTTDGLATTIVFFLVLTGDEDAEASAEGVDAVEAELRLGEA